MVGYCYGEKLLCFPAVPPVEGLEDFCFPLHVPVTKCGPRGRAGQAGKEAAVERVPIPKIRRGRSAVDAHTSSEQGWMGRSVFMLSTGHDGQDKLYGVCLYWNEPFMSRDDAGNARMLQSRRCFCMLTRLPVYEIHMKVLSMLVQDRAFHVTRFLQSDDGAAEDQRKWIISSGAVRMLQSYYSSLVPGAHLCGPSAAGCQTTVSVEGHMIPFAWDNDDEAKQGEAAAAKLGMPYIFAHLSTANVITLVTSLLLERKIIVQCEDITVLTAVVMALPLLIRPFAWLTSFIPLVPPCLYAFLAAPVPFIAGILTVPVGGYEDGVTVVQIESDQIWGTEDMPRLAILDDLAVKVSRRLLLGPADESLPCHLIMSDDVSMPYLPIPCWFRCLFFRSPPCHSGLLVATSAASCILPVT